MDGFPLFSKTWPSPYVKKVIKILNNKMKQFNEILKHFQPMACILTSIENSSASKSITAMSLLLPQIPIKWKTLYSINKNTIKKQKEQQIETPKTKTK